MKRKAELPRRGLWRTEVVRAVLSGHSILGIAFATIIYLVCLTGTLSVFMRDFQRWEQPDAPLVHYVSDQAVGRAVTGMGVRVGSDHAFFVSLPDDDFPRLTLSTGGDADDQTWYADQEGRLVSRQATPWISFLVELHTRLLLPESWGRFVVGLAGVALLSSLISGVLAQPRVFRDAFHLRLGGSRRLEQADLHNRLGVWPLPFHIVVSLTGALLGLSTVIVGVLALLLFKGDAQQVYALLVPPPPIADARPTSPPDIVSILATARSRAPQAQPRQLSVQHWGRRDARVELSASRPRLIAQQDSYVFNAGGHLVSEKHPAGQTVGEQILGSLGQLHFGWFGGIAVRIGYGLLGLALCVVTASGINVWLMRRRDKGRPAPYWERVWVAVVWGQPLILATVALISIATPAPIGVDTLTTSWTILTALSLLAAGFINVDAIKLASWLKISTGFLLAAIGAVSAFTRSWETDRSGLWIAFAASLGGLYLMSLNRNSQIPHSNQK